jgi:hypothetical protein
MLKSKVGYSICTSDDRKEGMRLVCCNTGAGPDDYVYLYCYPYEAPGKKSGDKFIFDSEAIYSEWLERESVRKRIEERESVND